jgi:hypothetical protein
VDPSKALTTASDSAAYAPITQGLVPRWAAPATGVGDCTATRGVACDCSFVVHGFAARGFWW